MTARVLPQAPLKSLIGFPSAASTVLLDVPAGKVGTVRVLVVTATESRDFLSFFSFFSFFSGGGFSAVGAVVVSWFGLSG